MKQAMTVLRVLQIAMLLSLGMFVFLAEWAHPMPDRMPQPVIFVVISIAGLTEAMVAFFLRRIIIGRAESLLIANPNDQVALNRWRTGYIAVLGLCESIGLYGLILRFLGFRQVFPFYLAGIVLLLYFTPRMPTSSTIT